VSKDPPSYFSPNGHCASVDPRTATGWTEHSPTDLGKFETSRNNQKIISTSFEHLKKCINFQN
jgi:hypothetical protein